MRKYWAAKRRHDLNRRASRQSGANVESRGCDMRIRRTRTIGVLLILSAAFGIAACRHDSPVQPQPPGATLTIEDGVFVMRLVASLEVENAARHNAAQYLPLSGIAAMSDQTFLKRNVTLSDNEDGSYKGYALRVTADGPRFEASLVPDNRGCGLAFFIDERILIYTGYGLGCQGNH